MHMYNFLCSDSLLYTSFFFFLLYIVFIHVIVHVCTRREGGGCLYMFHRDAQPTCLLIDPVGLGADVSPVSCIKGDVAE